VPVFNYETSRLPNYKIEGSNRTHGKHNRTQQRRTQETKTHSAQEEKSRATIEAARVRAGIEEEQSEEAGTRHGKEVEPQLALAIGAWPVNA
jgi:hypothetical protein